MNIIEKINKATQNGDLPKIFTFEDVVKWTKDKNIKYCQKGIEHEYEIESIRSSLWIGLSELPVIKIMDEDNKVLAYTFENIKIK